MESKINPQFKVPSAEERKMALGSMGGTKFSVKKSLDNVDKYWTPKTPPQPGEWLAEQFECGQGFEEFKVNKNAIVEPGKNDTICILPLDKKMSKKFLSDIKKMCKAFFHGCVIKMLPGIDINSIDKVQTRVLSLSDGTPLDFGTFPNPEVQSQVTQYNASNILSWLFRVYKPQNPRAICIIAVTTEDIYPDDTFSFVFGLANVMTQAGIFSFYRYSPEFNGETASISQEERDNLMLYRACKVMTHEIGHMFGIRHCIYYECGMNGCNHLEESQSRPLFYCCICYRKLQYAIGFDPCERYREIIKVCEEFGGLFENEVDWFRVRLADLEKTFAALQSKYPTPAIKK